MKIVKKSNLINTFCNNNYKKIGFVPTLGSLHAGHLSLIKKAKKQNEICIVSIFLNPKQFNNKKDLKTYPLDIEKDKIVCKKNGVDLLFIPNFKEVYNWKNKKTKFPKIKNIMEQKFRKGHFLGVLNVMEKLLNIIKCRKLYLGEKDFQQLKIIKDYIKLNKLKIKLIKCKTIGEKNMLAYSSRNKLLTKKNKEIGGKIVNFIIKLKRKERDFIEFKKKVLNEFKNQKVYYEYIENFNIFNLEKSNKINKKNKIFISFCLDKIRLIDNF